MNDTIMTVVGNVADSPRRTNTQNGVVTNFRLASTARRFDASSQAFVDSGTYWVDVECWNTLAGNVSASISKGDPVIVHGVITTHSWESETGRRYRDRLKAFAVGPDLTRGRSVFKRDRSERVPDGSDAAVVAEQSPSEAATGFEGFPPAEQLEPGRDYVREDPTFSSSEDPDLSAEPTQA